MTKSILSALGNHPVETLSGLVLAVVGVNMTAASANGETYQLYLGGLATTLGGILLSWTVGKAVSRSDALNEVRSQLGLVSKTLGQSAGQISRVVDQCIDHSLGSETGFMMVGQQAIIVGAQVSAIQEILGESFDTNNLLNTITEVDNLAERLDRKDRRGSEAEVAEVRSRLQEIRAELTGTSKGANRVSESLVCPKCKAPQQSSIGAYPGDTAAVNCYKCSHRFNVHRRSDGSVFTRSMNSVTRQAESDEVIAPRRFLTAECLGCHAEVRIPARPEGGVQLAVCTNCGVSLVFPPSGSPVTSDGKFEKLTGITAGRYGSGGTGARPIVHCEKCDRDYRAVIRKPGRYFAMDASCRRLFEVTEEALLDWRIANEPESLPPESAESVEGTA